MFNKYDGPTTKVDGRWCKVIYRKTKEGSTKLLKEVPKFLKREYCEHLNMYKNFFLIDNFND